MGSMVGEQWYSVTTGGAEDLVSFCTRFEEYNIILR